MKRIILIICICALLAIPISLFRSNYEKRINKAIESSQQSELKAKQAQEEAKLKDKQLQEQKQLLEQKDKELQAKAEQKAIIAQETRNPQIRTVTVSGTCADWIRAAGISDIANAQELIRRESGCNPNAVNKSSGACNVAQELPCGKSGCALGDGACSVKWLAGYVANRYGSFANAVAFHNSHGWY